MATNHQKQPNLDTVTTINEDGSRYNLHPADVKGRFTLLRRITAWLLITVYAALPWIPVNGKPAVFLNIAERKFHVFGLTLLTTDLWVLFFIITGLAFSLFVLSSVIGRVWCGWYCPYTVFLEHVYRRIERLIEGDAPKRKRLEKAPWNLSKIVKRTIKWGLYMLTSFVIAHIFLSYFISISSVWEHIGDGPKTHSTEFIFILIFTAVFTFFFGWFREQFCIIMCPYGRFQSALTDDDTITVAYDYKRGEPRGKKKKEVTEEVGDCIDCRRCVNVCPTGIDIRNGIQLECVACSACIDACNDIMKKVKRPTGLIRYDSLNGIETGKKKIIRTRTVLYAVFLAIGCLVMTTVFLKKARPFYAEMTRMSGSTFSATDAGVRNQFTFTIINKRNQEMTYDLSMEAPPHLEMKVGSNKIVLPPHGETEFTVVVFSSKEAYKGRSNISFTITSSDESNIKLESKFLGPNPSLYKEKKP